MESEPSTPRVLHLNTAQTWRGGERQVFFLARALQERGVGQWIVGQPGSELEERAHAAGLPFFGIRMRGEWDLVAVLRLRNFVRRERLNLIHAHTARAHGLALMAVMNLPRTQLVVSRRVDFPAARNWFSRRKYRSKHVAAYIAISENVKRVLLGDGIAPERIRIAYSGIDLARFDVTVDAATRGRIQDLRARWKLGPGTVVLGNVAALVPHKDQRTLLAALGILAREGVRDFRCLILGAGELRESLERQAWELGLSDPDAIVTFAGFREDIDDCYRLFDVFVMSSKEEGLGTAVLDAMGYGLPVVATSGGGIPEMIVHGQGGLLGPVGDAAALANNLRQMIAAPELRQRYGAFNREHVRRFGYQATCDATCAIYREILARPARSKQS